MYGSCKNALDKLTKLHNIQKTWRSGMPKSFSNHKEVSTQNIGKIEEGSKIGGDGLRMKEREYYDYPYKWKKKKRQCKEHEEQAAAMLMVRINIGLAGLMTTIMSRRSNSWSRIK